MDPQKASDKLKKLTKRIPASCSACRHRRTKCDRLLPCSECEKRKSNCDYHGARAPVSSASRRFRNSDECEQYIKQLEAKLQALEKSNPQSDTEPAEDLSTAQIDLVNEDLAYHLGRVTLGPRLRSSHPRALEAQAQTLLANLHAQPTPAVFLPKPAFTMGLIPAGPPTPLSELQANLPPRSEVAELAVNYFQSVNVFYPSINPHSWHETLTVCYQDHDSQELSTEAVHRLAAVLIVAAHGLLLRPNPHESEPSAKLKNISRAHNWCNLALTALTRPDQGAVLTQPSVWGIRAMSLLSVVELSSEDFDHGVFFWDLNSNLAWAIGLFKEPPGVDAKEVDELELESRRLLAWQVITMHLTGVVVAGGMRRPIDPDCYAVDLPGNVGCEIDPANGWPLDPVKAMQRVFAMSNHIKLSLILLNEKPTSYNELLKVEKSLVDLERTIPEQLQILISPEEQSVKLKVAHDPRQTLLRCAVWHRIIALRVWLHRPFIFLKEGIPDPERSRHLRELARSCRIHLLLYDYLPPDYMMHPVVMFMYIVSTSVACALGIVMCPNVFDSDFFLPQLRKFSDFLRLSSRRSIASSLAGKAVILIEKLIAQAEHSVNTSQPASKRPSGTGSAARLNLVTNDATQLKHKSPKSVSASNRDSIHPPLSLTSPVKLPKPQEPVLRHIAQPRSLHTPSLPLQDQLKLEAATQIYPSIQEPLSSPLPPIDFDLVGEFSFTFKPPSQSLTNTNILGFGLDLCTSLETNSDP